MTPLQRQYLLTAFTDTLASARRPGAPGSREQLNALGRVAWWWGTLHPDDALLAARTVQMMLGEQAVEALRWAEPWFNDSTAPVDLDAGSAAYVFFLCHLGVGTEEPPWTLRAGDLRAVSTWAESSVGTNPLRCATGTKSAVGWHNYPAWVASRRMGRMADEKHLQIIMKK